MKRLAAVAAAACLAATIVFASMPLAQASGPTILGAGSTWSQIAIDQWRSDVTRYGLSVNYQGVGSTQGRALFAGGTIDFGVSEIPYQQDDPRPNRPYAYLP